MIIKARIYLRNCWLMQRRKFIIFDYHKHDVFIMTSQRSCLLYLQETKLHISLLFSYESLPTVAVISKGQICVIMNQDDIYFHLKQDSPLFTQNWP